MTLHCGYALARDESLEDLDMGGGSLLSLKVTGQQSHGFATVIGGEVVAGGPPLHVHEVEDEVVVTPRGIEDFVGAQRDYLSGRGPETPFDAGAFGAVSGSHLRPVVGPPLT